MEEFKEALNIPLLKYLIIIKKILVLLLNFVLKRSENALIETRFTTERRALYFK